MANLVPLYAVLLILGGQAGLPLLVFTFLTKRVHRHPTFINFCITMIIYSVIFCLVFYTTEYNDTPTPSRGLCLAQASMIVGAFPMASMAALVLVFEIWATCQGADSAMLNFITKTSTTVILILIPYVALAGFTIVSALVAAKIPDSAKFANGFYCSIQLYPIRRLIVPIVNLVIVTVIVVFEVAIVVQWYRRWHRLKESFPLAERRPDAMLCFRVALFNFYTIITLATAIPFATNSGAHAFSYIVDAGLPIATFLVFGTQKDVFIAWGISKELPDLTRRDSTASEDSLSHFLPSSEGPLSNSVVSSRANSSLA
ncbi:hypothetical protein DENSPDRAFT_833164 [Dentipellis sp. KUC8613]|nr:hypothetical protein DENSPDRAFT_833164 [Dentipellis sp. KUC8613]